MLNLWNVVWRWLSWEQELLDSTICEIVRRIKTYLFSFFWVFVCFIIWRENCLFTEQISINQHIGILAAHQVFGLLVTQVTKNLLFVSGLLLSLWSCLFKDFVLFFFWLVQLASRFITITHRCILPCAWIRINVFCILNIIISAIKSRFLFDFFSLSFKWSSVNSLLLELVEINWFIHKTIRWYWNRLFGDCWVEFLLLHCNSCWSINPCTLWCLRIAFSMLTPCQAWFIAFCWLKFHLLLNLSNWVLIHL